MATGQSSGASDPCWWLLGCEPHLPTPGSPSQGAEQAQDSSSGAEVPSRPTWQCLQPEQLCVCVQCRMGPGSLRVQTGSLSCPGWSWRWISRPRPQSSWDHGPGPGSGSVRVLTVLPVTWGRRGASDMEQPRPRMEALPPGRWVSAQPVAEAWEPGWGLVLNAVAWRHLVAAQILPPRDQALSLPRPWAVNPPSSR